MDIARLETWAAHRGRRRVLLLISLFLPWYGVTVSLGAGVPSLGVSVTA